MPYHRYGDDDISDDTHHLIQAIDALAAQVQRVADALAHDDSDEGPFYDYRKLEAARKAWDALPLEEKYRRSVEVLRGPTVRPQPIDPDRITSFNPTDC